ncbi:hypothetical protein N8I77_003974 [Diaporthe amygdali]|uniref:Uncharacterized protein n=1 Tax=Phomopsis amygdali TaxID=1214568 RepID=A0AAD9W6G8_PHOAM|nr:hypothetical protein N8I77_003974 [Diaporthe amygdali]
MTQFLVVHPREGVEEPIQGMFNRQVKTSGVLSQIRHTELDEGLDNFQKLSTVRLSLNSSTEPQPSPRVRIPGAQSVDVLGHGDGLVKAPQHICAHVGVYTFEDAEPLRLADDRRRTRLKFWILLAVFAPRLPPQMHREGVGIYEAAVGESHVSVPLAGGQCLSAVRERPLEGQLVLPGPQFDVGGQGSSMACNCCTGGVGIGRHAEVKLSAVGLVQRDSAFPGAGIEIIQLSHELSGHRL